MSTHSNIERSYSSPLETHFDKLCLRLLPLIPPSIHPNEVTVVAFVGMLLTGVSFYLASFNKLWFIGAIAGLVIHVVGDSLDGAVARRNNQASPGGMFLDPFLDGLGTSAILFGLAFSNYIIPQLPMMAAVVWFLHLEIDLFSALLLKRWIFPVFSNFEMQLTLIILSLLGMTIGFPVWKIFNVSMNYFDLIIVVASTFSMFEAIKLARGLMRDVKKGE
jgi:phosphatidylglycerophosphate synthase